MLPQVGLYYPFIHFRDERWLKTAALYWRELARVVPKGYRLSDSRTARVLCEELDFVQPVDPAQPARQVESLFLEVLTQHAQALRAAGYDISSERGVWNHRGERHFEPTPPLLFASRTAHARNRIPVREGVAFCYQEEFTPRLREALTDCGLATDARLAPELQNRLSLVRGRWMALDARLAWIYKCAFVEVLARHGRYTPTTDQPDAHLASDGWDAERIAQSLLGGVGTTAAARSDGLTDAVGMLAVRLAVPARLDHVPVEKIIKLRKDHREEFAAFSAAVTQTVDELRQELTGEVLEEAQARDVRLAVEKRFDLPLKGLHDAMKAQGIGTVYGLANVKFEVPAMMGVISGAAGDLLHQPVAGTATAGAAAGAVLGFMNVRRAHQQQIKDLKAENPAAYLLSVQRGLKPHSLLRKLARLA
ncbi:DUF6236 family protein [Streptomyces griseoluteus]|uniref:DUF6236 family protein n=1 Tax=Streptomyces griseoluteus TaxID=29306 RepID=UPI0036FEBBC1